MQNQKRAAAEKIVVGEGPYLRMSPRDYRWNGSHRSKCEGPEGSVVDGHGLGSVQSVWGPAPAVFR